ncbi:MAG: hypothetical protein KJ737_27655 [Proteobacteria bacterium]|nr:hypothetical protein [Pseudomonadota bacterium]
MPENSVETLQDRILTATSNIITYLFDRFCPTSRKEGIALWRERIFFTIFLSTTVFGTVSYLSSMRIVLAAGMNWIAVFFTFFYFLLMAITFSRSIPYPVKVKLGLLSYYSIGMIVMISIGPVSCGHVWLFSFAVVSCLINGFKSGIIAIMINYISLYFIGTLLHHSMIVWDFSPLFTYHHWTASNLNFLFLVIVVVISLSTILDNFTRLLTKEIETSKQLLRLNKEFEIENAERRKTEIALKNSLDVLSRAKAHLVQSEKMAALGELVSGVTHELNTPIGVGVTASSFLEQKTREFGHLKATGNLSEKEIERYVKTAVDASSLIYQNMNHVAGLIKTFDQLAIDHANEEPRVFFLKDYIEELLVSLRIQTKKRQFNVEINCSEGIKLHSYPGAFSQIISHLVLNSVTHGFAHDHTGNIVFDIITENKILKFRYADDGKGMSELAVKRIFDPFYTTKRGKGRPGLGMNIVYNLVTQLMKGEIECKSMPGNGLEIFIQVPLEADETVSRKQTA